MFIKLENYLKSLFHNVYLARNLSQKLIWFIMFHQLENFPKSLFHNVQDRTTLE